MKKNAMLVWKGRKLMCNGACVAEVYRATAGGVWWATMPGEWNTREKAKRAVSRRFKLKD